MEQDLPLALIVVLFSSLVDLERAALPQGIQLSANKHLDGFENRRGDWKKVEGIGQAPKCH